jgi:hypothetical protein
MTQSHPHQSTSSTQQLLLTDVLPWSMDEPRSVLITDSIDADGRFVAYASVAQFLSPPRSHAAESGRTISDTNRRRAVSWYSFGPYTERLVIQSLRKLGHVQNKQSSLPPSLRIRAVSTELGDRILDAGSESVDFEGIHQSFLKELYHDIKGFAQGDKPVCGGSEPTSGSDDLLWIVLDDVTALASLVGDRAAYSFVHAICSLVGSCPERHVGLLIRCSNISSLASPRTNWIGAGGRESADGIDAMSCHLHGLPAWEQGLCELVDGIVDVQPLPSGPSLQHGHSSTVVHGRLIFSSCPGARGWKSIRSKTSRVQNPATSEPELLAPLIVNYCLTDTAVLAIRIRS